MGRFKTEKVVGRVVVKRSAGLRVGVGYVLGPSVETVDRVVSETPTTIGPGRGGPSGELGVLSSQVGGTAPRTRHGGH